MSACATCAIFKASQFKPCRAQVSLPIFRMQDFPEEVDDGYTGDLAEEFERVRLALRGRPHWLRPYMSREQATDLAAWQFLRFICRVPGQCSKCKGELPFSLMSLGMCVCTRCRKGRVQQWREQKREQHKAAVAAGVNQQCSRCERQLPQSRRTAAGRQPR